MPLFLRDELISKIKELFTEDEVAALEYTRGSKLMTIEDQIKTLYWRVEIRKPYHTMPEDIFLNHGAITIMDNCHIIEKIKHLKEIAEILADRRNYIKRNIQNIIESNDGKERSLRNKQKAYETLTQSKDRTGGSLRSEDYDDLEKLIDLEDQKATKTNIEINLKPIDHVSPLKTARYDPIGQIKISEANKYLIVPDSEEKLNQELEEVKEGMPDMPSFNTLQTGISRGKMRNVGIDSADSFSENIKNKSNLQINSRDTTALSALKAHEADMHNGRKIFWNKFRYFFEHYRPSTCR